MWWASLYFCEQSLVRLALTEASSSKGKPTTISLYDLTVPTFLQTVSAVGDFLDRAAAHCAETSADPDDFVHARLFDDMAPFHFQIECVAHHSVCALEAMKTALSHRPPWSDQFCSPACEP